MLSLLKNSYILFIILSLPTMVENFSIAMLASFLTRFCLSLRFYMTEANMALQWDLMSFPQATT